MCYSRQKKARSIFLYILGGHSCFPAPLLWKVCTHACAREGACKLQWKKGGGGSRKRKEPNCLLKPVSTSSVMNPHMKWEWGSAIYFFNRCYEKKKKTNLVLWSHFYKNKMRTILFQNETSSLGGVKCLLWKPQWNIYVYFFFSFQPAAATYTQTGQNGRLILDKTRSPQSAAALTCHLSTLRIFALTVFLQTSGTELFRNMSSFYSVIIVLCLLCISDLYLTLPVCLDTKTSLKPQLPSVSLILPQ